MKRSEVAAAVDCGVCVADLVRGLCERDHVGDLVAPGSSRNPTGLPASRPLDKRRYHAHETLRIDWNALARVDYPFLG